MQYTCIERDKFKTDGIGFLSKNMKPTILNRGERERTIP